MPNQNAPYRSGWSLEETPANSNHLRKPCAYIEMQVISYEWISLVYIYFFESIAGEGPTVELIYETLNEELFTQTKTRLQRNKPIKQKSSLWEFKSIEKKIEIILKKASPVSHRVDALIS